MKDIKKLLLLIICCFININFCYAYAGISINFNYPGSNDTDGSGTGDTDGDGMMDGGWTKDGYTCSYSYGMKTSYENMIGGFNQNNKSIINDVITPIESIKAGTSIGITVVEIKSASWQYEFEVTKKTNVCSRPTYNYTCYYPYNPYFRDVVLAEGEVSPGALGCTKKGNNRVGCKAWKENSTPASSEDEKYIKCENDAKSAAQGLLNNYVTSQSFQNIKLLDPNDSGATIDDAKTIFTNKKCDDCSDGSCSCTHTYTPKSVCMNKITSEVYYRDVENCGTDEFKIKNDVVDGVEHFHYFVPMNVTSGSFSLVLSENGDRQENEWCKEAIKANPTDFFDFFVGVRANGETFKFSNNITTAINSLDYGCYIRSEIRIPVSNGLYNVLDNKIKGYNLYVKNVDEYNPFPNPITRPDSLWLDWYESNYSGGSYNSGGSPNIRESFSEEPSYKLENVKAKEIRNLNSGLGNYLKVSLNENGSSDFIRNEIVFNKVANPNTYYKLGCGPINSVETIIDGTDIITNPLYQEGCK